MNRVNKQALNSADKFIELTEKMSHEDRVAFYEASLDDDLDKQNEISKKYGYLVLTPIEHTHTYQSAEEQAEMLLKHGTRSFENSGATLLKLMRDSYESLERLSDVSLDDCALVLTTAKDMEQNYFSDTIQNCILDAKFGENVGLITKAAFIADLIGCMRLRNELLVLSETLKMHAADTKILDIYKKKKAISDVNKSKASKPRHKLYPEVMSVIAATWEAYPGASKTGILDALAAHYYKKVSRNSLDEWIKSFENPPSKTGKFTAFELVLPQ